MMFRWAAPDSGALWMRRVAASFAGLSARKVSMGVLPFSRLQDWQETSRLDGRSEPPALLGTI